MIEVGYTLSLTVQAPLLTQAVGALAFGYDKASLRDGEAAVLPGSLIRGNLRHALQRFEELLRDTGNKNAAEALQKDIVRWFGDASSNATQSMEPVRARLHFDYYWKAQETADKNAAPRHRISLDEQTGSVKPGHLLVIESPYPAGRSVIFSGEIYSRCADAAEQQRLSRWLSKAAVYIPALGALKGAGFGKLLNANLEETVIDLTKPLTQGAFPAGLSRIRLSLTLDRPFCVAEPHTPDSNVFHGAEIIPGGVLKGALAKTLDDEQKTALQFDRLVFTHAKPEQAAAIPWSLCLVDDRMVDLALLAANYQHKSTFLFKKQAALEAPKFQADWKSAEWNKAKEACGMTAKINRHLAVHTAIDAETEVAAESQLFSLDCVAPQGQVWLADIDAGAVQEPQRAGVLTLMAQALSTPLRGIGKTKAKAAVELHTDHVILQTPQPIDGFFIVTLQTPARLLLSENVEGIPASGGADALQALYKQYWQTVSGECLELATYFARQTRVGGKFLHQHYWKKQSSYRPWWLTETGSVFVLRLSQQDKLEPAQTLLDQWRRLGLPQPEGGDSSGDWAWNPYIRENGYGEIRVNDAIHRDSKADEEEWLCL